MGRKLGPVWYMINILWRNENVFIFSRSPKYLKNPEEKLSEKEQNEINEEEKVKKPRVCRHLILIRHGQYNLDGLSDFERKLTTLGKFYCTYMFWIIWKPIRD